MPPLPPSPATVRVALSGLNQGHPWANIFHLQYVGTQPTSVILDGLCTSISTLWNTTLGTLSQTSCSLTQVVAVDISNASAATGISTAAHPGSDTSSTNMPTSVALCITWKTNLRWRGGHPRTYITGIGIGNLGAGTTWLTAYQTKAQSAAATWRTGLNSLSNGGNSWTMVCVRRHQTNTDGSHTVLNPAVPVPITGQLVDSRVDTQRRRLGPDVSA